MLDMDLEKRVHSAIRQMVIESVAESAHDLSDGGLAVALAECCFYHSIGASVDLDSNLRSEFLLFGEAPSRILVSTTDPSRIQQIAAEHGALAMVLGATIDGRLVIRNRQTPLIDCDISSLRNTWATALEGMIRQ
ncbi:MAG: AIR synthase-related protein [Bryobacteraceae bacterium]